MKSIKISIRQNDLVMLKIVIIFVRQFEKNKEMKKQSRTQRTPTSVGLRLTERRISRYISLVTSVAIASQTMVSSM